MSNPCDPFGALPGQQNCGSAAWFSIRTIFTWLLFLFLGVMLIGLFITYRLNPGIVPGAVLPAVMSPLSSWLIGILLLFVGFPMLIYFLSKLFLMWLRRLLCPIFCPIAAALREIVVQIDGVMQQIDAAVSGISTFSSNLQSFFTNLGNVGVPNIQGMVSTLSQDAQTLLGTNFVPDLINDGSTGAQNAINTLYSGLTNDVTTVIGNINDLSVPMQVVKSGLSAMKGFLNLIISALETFCCCCDSGKDGKNPSHAAA